MKFMVRSPGKDDESLDSALTASNWLKEYLLNAVFSFRPKLVHNKQRGLI